MIEKTLSQLIDKIENRYYGKYKGFVVDNDDPENLGRLRVKVPSILGEEVVTGWAMPCVPYGGASDQGFFFIPEIDAGVWVEFEEGNLEFPIWVGTFWSKPGGASEVPKPGDSQSPPTQKIIRTVKGHSIEIEDKDGEEKIVIFEKVNGNKITMDKNGVIIEDKNNNKITLSTSGVVITSNKIKLGGEGAFEPVVLGIKLLTWLAMHIHPTSMGPSGPPTPPPMMTDFCSQKNTTL